MCIPLSFQLSDHWFPLAPCPLCRLIDLVYAMSLGLCKGSHGYLLAYDGLEHISRTAITIPFSNMALVRGSAYALPGNQYDHTLGLNSMELKISHLPCSVTEFVRYADQYLDAGWFTANPKYACEKMNSQEDSCYNRWHHPPAYARSIARCRALVLPDMPFLR